MNSLSVSLRCLKHPLTVASIVLLLLNDHLFKAAFPSWWTGKLSDFAGLFFFPFLLATLFAVLLRERRAHYAGALAFVVTALWFALIKLSPDANHLMESGLSWLLGYPTRIILDPTDLIALVVLWPAWRLWQYQARQPQGLPSSQPAAWAVLGVASLATVATSAPYAENRVYNLAVGSDLTLYAIVETTFDGAAIYRSVDGGQTWTMEREWYAPQRWQEGEPRWIYTPPIPPEIESELAEEDSLPIVQCATDNPNQCFQITGEAYIEASEDGGQSWKTIWQHPPRNTYLLRSVLATRPSICDHYEGAQDPLDLILLPDTGGYRLVVAMDREGVLVRDPTGTWQRYAVANCAKPPPYAARNYQEAVQHTLWEVLLLLAVSFIVFSWRGWSRWQSVALIVFVVSLGFAIAFLAELVIPYSFNFLLPQSFWDWVTAGGLLVLGVGLRHWVLRQQARTNRRRAVGVFVVAYLPFVLWAFGWIPWYWVAMVLSLLALVGGTWWSVSERPGLRLLLSNRGGVDAGKQA